MSTDSESVLLEEITRRVHQHAETFPHCQLNPDKRVVSAILKGLVCRRVKFGDYYCPCRPVTGDPQTDSANICPCVMCEEEVARAGRCHCGLFVGRSD